jgi:hypothetical protein
MAIVGVGDNHTSAKVELLRNPKKSTSCEELSSREVDTHDRMNLERPTALSSALDGLAC